MKCNICGDDSHKFKEALILNKFNINYFQCSNCGFIQTEEAYWLDEAYNESITCADIGLVERNFITANITSSLISVLLDAENRFLDFGGGYGLFVRMMRDRGFDFYLMDKYSSNLFAKGFKIENLVNDEFELITAFEVFEHFPRPQENIEHLLSGTSNIFFSTHLVPPGPPPDEHWWYYATEYGQHLSLFSLNSLQFLARHFGLNLYTNGKTLHLLTKVTINPIVFRFIVNNKISNILNLIFRRDSLIPSDYENISGKSLGKT